MTPIKSAFNVHFVLKLLGGLVLVFAALEVVGMFTNDWPRRFVLNPVATIRGLIGK